MKQVLEKEYFQTLFFTCLQILFVAYRECIRFTLHTGWHDVNFINILHKKNLSQYFCAKNYKRWNVTRESCGKRFRMKNASLKCWWNRPLVLCFFYQQILVYTVLKHNTKFVIFNVFLRLPRIYEIFQMKNNIFNEFNQIIIRKYILLVL